MFKVELKGNAKTINEMVEMINIIINIEEKSGVPLKRDTPLRKGDKVKTN